MNHFSKLFLLTLLFVGLAACTPDEDAVSPGEGTSTEVTFRTLPAIDIRLRHFAIYGDRVFGGGTYFGCGGFNTRICHIGTNEGSVMGNQIQFAPDIHNNTLVAEFVDSYVNAPGVPITVASPIELPQLVSDYFGVAAVIILPGEYSVTHSPESPNGSATFNIMTIPNLLDGWGSDPASEDGSADFELDPSDWTYKYHFSIEEMLFHRSGEALGYFLRWEYLFPIAEVGSLPEQHTFQYELRETSCNRMLPGFRQRPDQELFDESTTVVVPNGTNIDRTVSETRAHYSLFLHAGLFESGKCYVIKITSDDGISTYKFIQG